MTVPGMVGRLMGTNWFSKHTMITCLLPNAVLWGTGFLVGGFIDPTALNELAGKFNAANAKLTLVLVIYGVFVVLGTYVTLNLQPMFLRLFRGEWNGVFGRGLVERLRTGFIKKVEATAGKDSALAVQSSTLYGVRELLDTVVGPGSKPKGVSAPTAIPTVQALAGDLAMLQADIEKQTLGGQTSVVVQAVDALAKRLGTIRLQVDNAGFKPSKAEREELNKVISKAAATLDPKRAELQALVDAARDQILDEVRGRFPQSTAAVAATRFGNAFRAAEEELRIRYGMNPWLFIPHLRMVLPTGYAETLLDDSLLGLNLMTTLGVLFPAFGLLIAAIIVWLPGTDYGSKEILSISIGILLGVIMYTNAVEAAVSYCDGIKALFDGHRTRIFTLLRLRVPQTLEDEKVLWRAVSSLLSQGLAPDPRYFAYATGTATDLRVLGTLPGPTTVVATRRATRAMTKFTAADLMSLKLYPEPTDQLVKMRDIDDKVVGKVLIAPLPAGAPVPERLLVDAGYAAKKVLCTVLCRLGTLPRGAVPGSRITIYPAAAPVAPGQVAIAHIDDVMVAAVDLLEARRDASPPPMSHSLTVLIPEARAPHLPGIFAGTPVITLDAP